MIALQPYMRRHPETTFVNGSGAEPLHNPAPNFFNFYTDGAQWNAGLGAYAYHDLGWRRAVIIAGRERGASRLPRSAPSWRSSARSAGRSPNASGSPSTRPISSTVGAVPSRGVDGLFLSTLGPPIVQALADGYPPLRGKNVSRRIVLSSTDQYGVPQLKRMWRRATGLVYAAAGGGPGIAPGSRYLTDFRKAFPQIPSSLYGGHRPRLLRRRRPLRWMPSCGCTEISRLASAGSVPPCPASRSMGRAVESRWTQTAGRSRPSPSTGSRAPNSSRT